MATGLELTETERISGGVALDFPANNDETTPSSAKTPPRRLRQRLMETKSPSSAEEIEVKLREANLRRQQFYELLSSKARTKSKSLSLSCPQEEDLGQRLEAKLNAAQQKRLSILAKVQKRLARLDELRQAAKNGVEMRIEKERDELGIKVESKVRQAEANRMRLLKACRQRSVAKRERAAHLLMKKLVQESRYKECVQTAIQQKRAAAEKKRLGLLEAEKTRARARVLKVQCVVKSIYSQREIERKRMKDQLEVRLQRAKKQRAEYLRQRRTLHGFNHADPKMMLEPGEHLSRMLVRCWRRFVRSSKTNHALAKAYKALGIDKESIKSMPFEQLALQIESATTIQTLKALLDRLEMRLTLSQPASGQSSVDNIDHLLKRLASPNRRVIKGSPAKRKEPKTDGSTKEVAQSPMKLRRYPVRVVLCAYMIIGHADVVFSGRSEHEISLAESAATFVHEFELLIKIILDDTVENAMRKNFRSQLGTFDRAWCSYLYHFVVWKVKDAKVLEEDMVRAACQLERSMMQTCKLTADGDDGCLTHDMRTTQNKVTEDQNLLRENLQHLYNSSGIKRMECPLSDMHSQCTEAKESECPPASSTANILSSFLPGSSNGPLVSVAGETGYPAEGGKRSSHIVGSLFEKDDSFPSKEASAFTSDSENNKDSLMSSGEMFVSENEIIVNDLVHGNDHAFADNFNVGNEDQNSLKGQVRKVMEKAFWDGVMDSMKQDKPDFSWVLKLIREVRDELFEISPQSWRSEINETIDIDNLSQVLRSGALDMDYFGKILEFALVTLRKLSAPANDEELKSTHCNFLKELGDMARDGDKSKVSYAVLMIKGLRFVLEQIQTLKREISKARMRIVEPLIKGPAGLEYLKKSFADRYGPPIDAPTSLPLTRQWFSSVRVYAEQEWDEYNSSLSTITVTDVRFSQETIPAKLRTGGSISMPSRLEFPFTVTGNEQPECEGEMVDLFVRLGLLKLVSEVGGLIPEALPETLKLNLSRLRTIQFQLQKIIVIAISVLVLRQTLLSEKLVATSVDMENIASKCVKQLSGLSDSAEDVGLLEIVEAIGELLDGHNHFSDPEKLQRMKQVMASMLAKSLQAGDAIFTRVSNAVYTALRGAVLGGTRVKGLQLVEAVLQRIGAALLADKLVEAARVIIVVATISRNIHGAWYEELLKIL